MSGTAADRTAAASPSCLPQIGVVLQGPLGSRGRSGATHHIRFSDVDEEHVVDYRCDECIAASVERARDCVRDIVLGTWASEDTSRLAELCPELRIQQIDDTTRRLPRMGTVIPGNNKFRQAATTLAGLEALDSGCDHVLKVRTDQLVDIPTVVEFLAGQAAAGRRRIWMPHVRASRPARMPDFYFAGPREDLRAGLLAFMEPPEFFHNVHLDLFFKFAWHLWGPRAGLRRFHFTEGAWATRRQNEIIRYGWKHLFGLLPEAVYRAVRWRGEPMYLDGSEDYLFAETPEATLLARIEAESESRQAPGALRRAKYLLTPGVRRQLKRLKARI